MGVSSTSGTLVIFIDQSELIYNFLMRQNENDWVCTPSSKSEKKKRERKKTEHICANAIEFSKRAKYIRPTLELENIVTGRYKLQ